MVAQLICLPLDDTLGAGSAGISSLLELGGAAPSSGMGSALLDATMLCCVSALSGGSVAGCLKGDLLTIADCVI